MWLGEEEHLYSCSLKLRSVNFLEQPTLGGRYKVKIRFHHEGASAKLLQKDNSYHLYFDKPQRAITPGQAAVIYENDKLLGGGWIA